MKTVKLIGLTGQSGAGKSTAARFFAAHGACVISADAIVRELYRGQSPCVKSIAACFGADCVAADGSIDRSVLAERAFSCAENTALLGRLVHPFVTSRLLELLKGKNGIVFYDAPQLFESGADVICDRVVAVTADAAVRKKRVMARDGITEAQADSRLNAQYSEAFFRDNSDMVIQNNGGAAELRRQVDQVYEIILNEVT